YTLTPPRPPTSTLFPYTTLFRSPVAESSSPSTSALDRASKPLRDRPIPDLLTEIPGPRAREHVAFDEQWTSPSLPRAYPLVPVRDRKSTRLNSSHVAISYAVFCL